MDKEQKTSMEIQIGNRLIAEFMGYEIEQKYFITDISIARKNGEQYFASKLKYHSSWDWLMPVVEKIESVSIHIYTTSVNLRFRSCIIRCSPVLKSKEDIFYCDKISHNKIEATWLGIVEFIKWYNIKKTYRK